MRFSEILMALAVPLIWGLGVTFSKPVVDQFPPILLMALRFSVTSLVLVWFVTPPWQLMRSLFVIALISAAVQYALTFNGLRLLDASTAVLVVQLEVPFCTFLAIVFLKERVTLRKWLGIAVAFVGVLLITGEPRFEDNHLGILLVIGGALSWAIGQVMVRNLGQIGGFTVIAWVAVLATPQLFIVSAIFETGQVEAVRSAGFLVWAVVVYLGLIMTAVAYGLWYTLLGRHPLSQLAPFLLLLPVFSVIANIILLDEQLTLMLIIGGSTIIGGVAFIVFEQSPNVDDT